MTWARAGSLVQYPEVARRFGLDPNRMFRRARIDPMRLAHSEARISARAFATLLEESALEAGRPDFGLAMAEARSLAELGPVSLLLQHQDTLRGAIEAFVEYQHLLTPAIALALDEDEDVAILRTELLIDVPFPPRQTQDFLMGTIHRTFTTLGGRSWQPDAVHFAAEPAASIEPYRRTFGTAPVFMSEFNGFVYQPSMLQAVNHAAEARMGNYARHYLETLLPPREPGMASESARRSIYLLLPSGRATIDHVADDLGLGTRRLQRQLEREGQSFSGLLNDARRELAARYLAIPGYSVSAVAAMMGYTSLSSFTRWFTGEFGVAPSAWRKAA